MLSSDIMRGYNDTILLSILTNGPSYGYEISKQIRVRTNEAYVMKETTLYSAFNRLEKNGYIESFFQNETFGKQRTYYRITPSGEIFYQEKCKEWDLTQEVVNQFIQGGHYGHDSNLHQ